MSLIKQEAQAFLMDPNAFSINLKQDMDEHQNEDEEENEQMEDVEQDGEIIDDENNMNQVRNNEFQ